MTVVNHATVVGVFHNRQEARQAVDELHQAGLRDDQIGVVAREGGTGAGQEGTGEASSKWEEGAATGIAAGAGVGALWALGIAAGVMPAIGPIIAGGLLASVLASAAGGAAVAGIIGALIGMGIPEHEAQYYESEFQAGRTIVTVRAPGRYEEAWEILRRHGAYNMNTVAGTAPGTVPVAVPVAMPVEPTTAREIDVATQPQAAPAPAQRDEVSGQQQTASGPASTSDPRSGGGVHIPVRGE